MDIQILALITPPRNPALQINLLEKNDFRLQNIEASLKNGFLDSEMAVMLDLINLEMICQSPGTGVNVKKGCCHK